MPENMIIPCPHCHSRNRVITDKRLDAVCGKCQGELFIDHPLDLTEQNFAAHVQGSDLPLLVDFWAPWCGPCKMMSGAYAEAAKNLNPDIRAAKVNTEQEQILAAQFGIQSIPTLILFKGGRAVDRITGALDARNLESWARSRAI